jgi:hypothetical protein
MAEAKSRGPAKAELPAQRIEKIYFRGRQPQEPENTRRQFFPRASLLNFRKDGRVINFPLYAISLFPRPAVPLRSPQYAASSCCR